MMRTTTQGKRAGAVLLALLLASILSLIAAPVSRGQSSGASAPPDPPKRTTQADDQQRSSVSSGLLQKAEREGSVRVIVGLRADFAPEGELGRSAVAGQRDRIKSAQAGVRDDLRGTGYQTVREYETVPAIVLEVPASALQALERSPRVSSIGEDRLSPAALAESTGKVQAPTMWNSGYSGAGQTVAVLDSGVDKSHPFLSGKVVAEACYSAGGNCPGGALNSTVAGSGVHCKFAPIGCAHGTHVAGIAAGSNASFAGVAKGANVMAVQVFSRFTGHTCVDKGQREDPCALSYTSDQIAGLDRVNQLTATRKFSSVNISIGGGRETGYCDADPGAPEMKKAIGNLRTKGIPTVISSGNSNYADAIGFPACISNAISVGNTTDQDTVYSHPTNPNDGSNSAAILSLLAPGSEINSSVPGGTYQEYWGTSMAAPHVAGAWAILKQKAPTASVDSILTALKQTGTPVRDTRAAGGVTKPRINIADAAKLFSGPTGTIKINAGAASTQNLSNKLTLSATDADGVAQMRFHNDSGIWTAWEPYATTKTWTLRNAQGERTVFVQYRDAKGNVSPETAIKDTIEYDTVSPSISAITPAPGARNVPLDASVKITFNDDMMASTVTPQNVFIRRLNNDGTYGEITEDVTYYASSRTAVLNPVNNLVAGATYVVSVQGGPEGSGVKDTAYNEIDQDPGTPGTQGHFWRLYTF